MKIWTGAGLKVIALMMCVALTGCGGSVENPVAAHYDNFNAYTKYYRYLMDSGKNVIVCTIGPTQDEWLAEWDRPYYELSHMIDFNAKLASWAEENGVKVIDLYDYVVNNVQIDSADGIHYLPRPNRIYGNI